MCSETFVTVARDVMFICSAIGILESESFLSPFLLFLSFAFPFLPPPLPPSPPFPVVTANIWGGTGRMGIVKKHGLGSLLVATACA
jgi:hypothetical protein